MTTLSLPISTPTLSHHAARTLEQAEALASSAWSEISLAGRIFLVASGITAVWGMMLSASFAASGMTCAAF